MRCRGGSPGREGREGQAGCAGPPLQSGEDGRAQGGREAGGGPGQVLPQGTCQAGGGGLGTLGAAEGALPKTRPSWEALKASSPSSTPTPPSVREAALNRTAGMWALSGHRAKSGLHTAPALRVGTAPQGPGGLGSVVATSPAPTGCHCQVHRGSVCSRREGPVFAHPPLPYTRPDRSWRGGRGPGWDAGEPQFTGPNAARRQGPVCSRTTGDVSPCFRGRGGPAREHRLQAQPSGHHGPRAWLSSPRAGGRARAEALPDGLVPRVHLCPQDALPPPRGLLALAQQEGMGEASGLGGEGDWKPEEHPRARPGEQKRISRADQA